MQTSLRMRTLAFVLGILIPVVISASDDNPGAKGPEGKRAWEVSVEERIGERSDRSAARARVERARKEKRAPTSVKDGQVTWLNVTDVIYGRQTPHLLLPTELFENIVRNGFILTGYREAVAHGIAHAGLPSTFWTDLERVSQLYLEDLREQHRLAEMRDKIASHGLQQALHSRLCANRADALANARRMFGPSLDVFMYQHIAPTISLHIDHVETAASLEARERGCR